MDALILGRKVDRESRQRAATGLQQEGEEVEAYEEECISPWRDRREVGVIDDNDAGEAQVYCCCNEYRGDCKAN